MNRFPIKFTIVTAAFFIGCLSVSLWLFNLDKKNENSDISSINIETPIVEINEELPAGIFTEEENPLDSLWIEKNITYFNGYKIFRYCGENEDNETPCKLKVSKQGKILAVFDTHKKGLPDYAFFNFLGENDKQLIIQEYSGGAHCCYDYYIYDLKPEFRKIYDSSKFDSANEIGNGLFPVDIDEDGVFEFRRDVMTFDYFYASHAGSVFPPAVFQYDKTTDQYILANKKFSTYIVELISSEWYSKQNSKDIDEYSDLRKFYFLMYAGKREEAWQHYDEHLYLNTESYFDKDFKETYRQEAMKIFSEDPTYLSIYGK